MLPVFFSPNPLLKDFVENIAILEYDFTEEQPLSPIYAYVPTFTRFLCFYMADTVKVKKKDEPFKDRARSLIIGLQSKPVVLDLGRKHLTVLVALKPSAMYRLIGVAQDTMIDLDFDAKIFLGQEIDGLLESMMSTATHIEKISIIQEYLLTKLSVLRPAIPFDDAINRLLEAGGNISVEEIATIACLSTRQCERISRERLGFSPKLYCRLVRFTNAYQYKETFPAENWTNIAHKCGYFDQAHLNRDFKYFAGINPGTIKEASLESSVRFQIVGIEGAFK
ncbi:MAG: helix-turn-helix domain-containing protein [Ferruginibacter sp.]